MSYFKVIGIFLATVAVLAGSIIGFGCANNTESTSAAPEFEELGPPPVEVTVDQLYAEYMADKAAADAKYKGERLLFSGVEVEEIESIFADSGQDPLIYIVNHSVEFRPRYITDTVLVRKGFVVDIVGEIRGVFGVVNHYLVVGDCWVKIVEGDIGVAYEDPDY